MPYLVDSGKDGLYTIRMQPPITFEEIISAIKESEYFINSEFELWDFSSSWYDLSNDELEVLARRARAKPKRPKKTAILVSESFQYGLSRIYSTHSEEGDTKVQVFRSEEEALNWLKETDSGG